MQYAWVCTADCLLDVQCEIGSTSPGCPSSRAQLQGPIPRCGQSWVWLMRSRQTPHPWCTMRASMGRPVQAVSKLAVNAGTLLN